MNNTHDSKISTSFCSIDKSIGGFHYGNLITLAGRPCMRTEYFSCTMMRNWIQNDMIDDGFVFFSLINKRNDVAKLISELSNTDSTDVNKWVLEPHYSGIELASLCDKIKGYAWKKNKRVFVIDNFNMIEHKSSIDLRHEKHIIAKELLKLAHELDIIIIVDAILFSYYIEEREGMYAKTPSLSDLGYKGWSGDLDVFSDVVLGFWSPEKCHIYIDEEGEDLRNAVCVEILKNINDDTSEGRRFTLYKDNRINRINVLKNIISKGLISS